MKPDNSIEARLNRRANLAKERPLIAPDKSAALRRQLGDEVHRARFRRRNWRGLALVLGLAAAALLLLFNPSPASFETLDFGVGEATAKFLSPEGRVFTGRDQLRSRNTTTAPGPEFLFLEIVAKGDVHVAVRVNVNGLWTPVSVGPETFIQADGDLLVQIPWSEEGVSVLLIMSKHPIPAHLIDEQLESATWEALADRLGCQTLLQEL